MLRSRVLLLLVPWALIPALLVPYAFFTSDFRVLLWAIEEPYIPFWLLLMMNIFGALVSGVFLYRLEPIGMRVFEFCALFTLAHVSYLAMLEKRHGILVIAFLIAALFVAIREWIFQVLSLSFFRSNRSWWEATPKPLPDLTATITGSGGKKQEGLIVSNLDAEGCFVFGDKHAPLSQPTEISIANGDRKLFTCPVVLEYRTSDGLGLGLRFKSRGMATDLNKDMVEFIGFLRRRGYVE